MALGDSVVSICNMALDVLGENPIVSVFPPDNTERAIACARRYDDCRRFTLRNGLWNCAKKQAQLAANPVAPLFKYSAQYPLPGDFIRVAEVDDSGRSKYEVLGNQLMTDASSGGVLDLDYIYDLQDPTQFDPGLVHNVAAQLASEISMPITGSVMKFQNALKLIEGKADTARLVDSQDNSPEEWDVDIWLASRYP